MSSVAGVTTVKVDDKEYRLWLGMSGLAALQEKRGQDVLQQLNPPKGASDNWLPDFGIVRDIMLEALRRYHADEANEFLVDDIMVQNPKAFEYLTAGTFPDESAESGGSGSVGNGKGPAQTA